MPSDHDLIKPDFAAMTLRPLLLPLFIGVPIILGSLLVSPGSGVFLLVLLSVIVAIQFAWSNYKYNKTEYIISADKIRLKTGTPFSDTDIELLWSKVVQAQLDRGVIQKFLFGSGDIVLEAAGQAESEIRLRHLSEPDNLFENILNNLPEKKNISEDQLLASHQQSRTGIWLDLLLATGLPVLIVVVLSALVLTFGNYRFPVFKYLVPGGLILFSLSSCFLPCEKFIPLTEFTVIM